MIICVYPKELAGVPQEILSKSHLHRLCLAAVFAQRETKFTLSHLCKDVLETLICLTHLGGKYTFHHQTLTIYPLKRLPSTPFSVTILESGSTLRFFLPIFASLSVPVTLTLGETLWHRPRQELIDILVQKGAKYEEDEASCSFIITGPLSGGEYGISGSTSSQYITGLLYALPFLPKESFVSLTSPLVSAPYVDLTLSTLTQFGVLIQRDGNRFFPLATTYCSVGEYSVELDWSNFSFWLILSLFHPKIFLSIPSFATKQGDKEILHILDKLGGKLYKTPKGYKIKGDSLLPLSLSMTHIPDLFPILVVLTSKIPGSHCFFDIHRITEKECNRVKAMEMNLGKLGIAVKTEKNTFSFTVPPELEGENSSPFFSQTTPTVEGFEDHRIVMAMALFSLIHQIPLRIIGGEAVEKSYPHFWDTLKDLGGIIKEE